VRKPEGFGARERAVAAVSRSRGDLDAIRASGEEPLARQLLREAGEDPTASFFDIAVEAQEPR